MSKCLSRVWPCTRAGTWVGGKQTRGVWKMFWRAPYSTSVRLLGLHLCNPKHKLGNAVSNGECLSALWGVDWCWDQGAGVGRTCPRRDTEPLIQINTVEKFTFVVSLVLSLSYIVEIGFCELIGNLISLRKPLSTQFSNKLLVLVCMLGIKLAVLLWYFFSLNLPNIYKERVWVFEIGVDFTNKFISFNSMAFNVFWLQLLVINIFYIVTNKTHIYYVSTYGHKCFTKTLLLLPSEFISIFKKKCGWWPPSWFLNPLVDRNPVWKTPL